MEETVNNQWKLNNDIQINGRQFAGYIMSNLSGSAEGSRNVMGSREHHHLLLHARVIL